MPGACRLRAVIGPTGTTGDDPGTIIDRRGPCDAPGLCAIAQELFDFDPVCV